MTTYTETVNFLYTQLPMFSRVGAAAFKKDLANIRALCKALDDPQEKFKAIHIAGTNGKGSVSHLLAAILQRSGYKTGLYTSPHLVDFRERIKINGEMASRKFVVDFVEKNMDLIRNIQPSFFEISVAMAFEWFASNQVDVAIVEVGLGGRLDSTNIIKPSLSVITNISFDHQHILGNSLRAIAGEKAGIIKPEVPVVVGETHPETESVFLEKAGHCKSPIIFADQKREILSIDHQPGEMMIRLRKSGEIEIQEYKLDLIGNYQAKNLLTVLSTTDMLQKEGWPIEEKTIYEALGQVKRLTGLRGRWEILADCPLTIADVAHNPAGISEVMQQVNQLSFRQLFIITGFVKDKQIEEMLALFPGKARYFFCNANIPRAMPAQALYDLARQKGLMGETCMQVKAALEKARKIASPEDVILVCGSVFLVGELLSSFK